MPALADTLAFRIDDGLTQNAFLRTGQVAAHAVVTSGRAPRIVVAFPAGNTGVGLWLEPLREPVHVAIERDLEPVVRDGLRGVSLAIACPASELRVRGAVLGSVRALRRFHRTGEIAQRCSREIAGGVLRLARTTLARRRVALTIEPRHGASVRLDGDRVVLASSGGPLHLAITALADDPPLAPLAQGSLIAPGHDVDEGPLRALAFLSYEDRMLAGSWRFLTYFGRDTLLSLRLLGRVASPSLMEAGLGAVLDRLDPSGAVAHEEAVGEEAASLRFADGLPASDDAPVLDHGMIDDDFLLAPVAADYLLDHADPERARAFLARRTPSGETYARALARNLAFVAGRAAPFAEAPSWRTLVTLPDGKRVGDWRDSVDGLGGGRAPYGVNAALVPGALDAAALLHASPLLGADPIPTARARCLARAWDRAADLFRVVVPHEEARRRLALYGAAIDVDPAPAIAAIQGDVAFPAIALDAHGAPVEVMSSDDGFLLLFGRPSIAALDEAAARVLCPFPLGLGTPVGVLVASPAFAKDSAVYARFTAGHYHGTVIWPFQHALFVAGFDRQLARDDLPPATRARVTSARRAVLDLVTATRAFGTAELWSIRHRGGRWEHVPFGDSASHHTESNAAQLWSAAQLAIDRG
jgi:hypothetical protein